LNGFAVVLRDIGHNSVGEYMTTGNSSAHQPKLWSVKEAARYLDCSVSWIYQQSAKGLLPHRKLGASLKFIPSELEDWVKRQPGKQLDDAKPAH
jgi:excisionase family DNA binding protein